MEKIEQYALTLQNNITQCSMQSNQITVSPVNFGYIRQQMVSPNIKTSFALDTKKGRIISNSNSLPTRSKRVMI